MDTTNTNTNTDIKKKRRGKRGGAAVKRSTDALEEKTETLFTLDRSGASPEPNQLEPEQEPEPEPLNSEQQSSEKEKEKEKEKKKRRGKRGGAAAKEREKKSDDNDEAYASINVVQDDSPQLEDEVDEGAQVSKDDKWAARMERKKKYAEAGITDPNAYDHIAATHGTYRDSDKLLPHRDPNLPDQPELGRVDPDVQVYFMSVEKMLDEQEFETDEDRILFVQNVYREVGANDVKLAADSECSRVLEKLIRLSSDVQVRRLMRSFTGMYSELFRHRFASHVAQTLLSLVADIVEREQIHGPAPEPEDEDPVEGAPDLGPLPSMESLFTSLCDELSNQWTSLMTLNVASGESLLPPKSSSLRSKKSTKYNAKNNNAAPAGPAAKTADRKTAAGISKKRKVPPSFQQVLESISQSVLDSLSEYEIRSFAGHAVANPVLQILVSIKPAGQGLIRSIMEIDSDKGYAFMGSLITDTVGSHLVEKILVNASPKDFHTLYTRHFKGNLTSLASHPIANFVIQHLIQNTRNGLQLRVLMDELLGPDGTGMEKLFFRNRQGVVIKILEACVRHTADCQPQVLTSFTNAFHATTPDQQKLLTPLVLTQQTYEDYNTAPGKFDYHGATMLEHLLNFQEPSAKLFINSFLSLPASETFKWLTTPLGSRVYEQVLRSQSTPLPAKKKILHGLTGHFATLACDKYASHIVDAAWAVSDIDAKERIAAELAKSKAQLESSFTGKFVLKNCRVESFRREGRDVWAEKVAGVDRKRAMFKEFEDILEDEGDEEVVVEGEKEGKKVSKAAEKAAKEEDSLWSTGKYDQTMAALGFTADSKKGKKKSGDLLLDDEDETPKKKKDSKRAREDDEVDGKEAKKVAAAEDDMEDVFAALAATTKGGDSKKKVKKSK
ncbi:ARM repeat-containing protein [Rhizoclosmatium globosum]|uniref:Nucleolar protein 9 n=1 Tax=Rhizoclosmatium globosum TaxID=329046 RepID=A0A1Y2CB91_9FUNG|nr:ARM repeat-containing protein [Rhizoclosmatium globosum]|eukprot:ORY44321.1 ARM repeat-containing protein [Rhizoclosmatium globosum]